MTICEILGYGNLFTLPFGMSGATPTHLQALEAESIHIMREVVAECENPVMAKIVP